jgi:acyl-CoA synthetase (AMP-forming)/AMP-acid ligase II/thioesterase domain-containing protein
VPTPSYSDNLPRLLEFAAQQKGRGIAFVDGSRLTYQDLLDLARRQLRGLRAAGLAPGDRVLVVADEPETFLSVFWAATLGGFIPCPVAPVWGDNTRWATLLGHLNQVLGGPLLVASKDAYTELPAIRGLRAVLADDLADEEGEPDYEPHQPEPGDLALLMLTSGSTGLPKAVRLTHANLLAAIAGKAGALNTTASDTMLNWISHDHIAAIEAHLLPMHAGANQVVARPTVVLGDPLRFVELLWAHRVTITFTPNFLFGQINQALAQRPPAAQTDLSAVRYIISGGEATVTATVRRFLDALAPQGLRGDVVVPAFGMTETCAGSVFNLEFGRETAEFASLGRPERGLEIRIADEDETILATTAAQDAESQAAGRSGAGEVQLRGPMITDGYFANEAATRDAFTADGWFRTGDLGVLDGGRLTLTGRSKDSIIVSGVNYFSHELETLLGDLDGVTAGQVAAFPTRPGGADTEQLAIVFVPQTGDDAALFRTIVAIRSGTVLRWGFRPAQILPVTAADIPRGGLGKIQRSKIRQSLESGQLAAAADRAAAVTRRFLGEHVAAEGEDESRLAEIFGRVLAADPETISVTASFFDLGGTSLDVLRLKLEIEQAFGAGDLPVASILQAPSVRLLAGRLTAGPGTGYDPLVLLQHTGDGVPLFCVHPGLGEVLVFVNLAKYLVNERPFYALRARGFGSGEEPFGSFAEMVDAYATAIRRVQPHGPYAVAGYSYGGAVAFEIAKAIEAQGEEVPFVGIFNLPPHIAGRMNEITFTDGAINLALFLSLIGPDDIAPLRERLVKLSEADQLAYLIEQAPPRRLTELDLDLPGFAAWVEVAQAMVHLGRDYEPSGTVDMARVFYCEPLKGTKEDWLNLQLRAWGDFTRRGGRFIEVGGEHYTLMDPQHVQEFQAVLRRELGDALGKE